MPASQAQGRRGHRASAQAAMLDVAARQRQFVIDRRAYAASLTELGLTLPPAITDRYAVTVEAPGDARPPTFRIVATPRGGQSSDRCGALSVDQTGNRLPAGCW
jgi:type IV pilus assembly protein PilE